MSRISQRFVRLLLLATALWLPVEAAAALVMPLTLLGQRASHGGSVSKDAGNGMQPSCHGALAGTSAMHATASSSADTRDAAGHTTGGGHDGSDCAQCMVCQFACSGFLAATLAAPRMLPAAGPLIASPALVFDDSLPEPPEQPPRNVG